jgi:hypothetical protein
MTVSVGEELVEEGSIEEGKKDGERLGLGLADGDGEALGVNEKEGEGEGL